MNISPSVGCKTQSPKLNLGFHQLQSVTLFPSVLNIKPPLWVASSLVKDPCGTSLWSARQQQHQHDIIAAAGWCHPPQARTRSVGNNITLGSHLSEASCCGEESDRGCTRRRDEGQEEKMLRLFDEFRSKQVEHPSKLKPSIKLEESLDKLSYWWQQHLLGCGRKTQQKHLNHKLQRRQMTLKGTTPELSLGLI